MTRYCVKQKVPRRRNPTTKAKLGLAMWRKGAQTQIKRSPIGVKLHRHVPDIPRSPLCEGGGDWSHSRAADQLGHPTPTWRRSARTMIGWFLSPHQRRLHGYSSRDWFNGWQFAQDTKACKEAQLHPISTIHLMMV